MEGYCNQLYLPLSFVSPLIPLLSFSSEPIWEEERKRNRFKAVTNDLKTVLEQEYGKAKQLKPRERGEVQLQNSDIKVLASFQRSYLGWDGREPGTALS